jgi:hypothetical protein
LTDRSFEVLKRRLPSDVLQKTRPLKNKSFATENAFRTIVTRILGRRDSNAYLPVIVDCLVERLTQEQNVAIPWSQEDQSITGASYGFLADVTHERGLRGPSITNLRARFYFTESGWEQVGRHVAAEARRLGHVVKVIRRKEPNLSEVVYRDDLQVAVLPRQGW